MSDEKQTKEDMEHLIAQPQFKRFLFRVIQSAGIFSATTNGSEGRNLVSEGRRNLGLEILDMAEKGQPAAHSQQLPILTLIQTLVEEAQQQPEKPHAKYDRNAEIADADEA